MGFLRVCLAVPRGSGVALALVKARRSKSRQRQRGRRRNSGKVIIHTIRGFRTAIRVRYTNPPSTSLQDRWWRNDPIDRARRRRDRA